MAYATSLPPQLLVPSIGGKPALWGYTSADGSTLVLASGYITNGHALGMRLDDFIMFTVAASTTVVGFGKIGAVTASSAATIVAGTLTSTT